MLDNTYFLLISREYAFFWLLFILYGRVKADMQAAENLGWDVAESTNPEGGRVLPKKIRRRRMVEGRRAESVFMRPAIRRWISSRFLV